MTAIYQMNYIDADTILFRPATMCQNNFITVTHKETGWEQRFKGVEEFYGRGNKRNKGWIGEQNAKREGTDRPLISVDDFEIVKGSELADLEGLVLDNAMSIIDFTVGNIKKQHMSEDYRLVIGGEGNFRYDAAHIQPYKGNRVEKPMLFQQLREMFIEKYRSKIIIADGIEADDYLGIKGKENHDHYVNTGEWKYLLSYVDKDLKMIHSPRLNYDKLDEGIFINTEEEAVRHFLYQLLCGDKSTDNIQGLGKVVPTVKERFGLRPLLVDQLLLRRSLRPSLSRKQ